MKAVVILAESKFGLAENGVCVGIVWRGGKNCLCFRDGFLILPISEQRGAETDVRGIIFRLLGECFLKIRDAFSEVILRKICGAQFLFG